MRARAFTLRTFMAPAPPGRRRSLRVQHQEQRPPEMRAGVLEAAQHAHRHAHDEEVAEALIEEDLQGERESLHPRTVAKGRCPVTSSSSARRSGALRSVSPAMIARSPPEAAREQPHRPPADAAARARSAPGAGHAPLYCRGRRESPGPVHGVSG